MERALLQLLEPVKDRFTEGNAGLHLGDFAVHYGERSARMEAFSRVLWGLAPLWSQGGGLEYLPLFREGLANGTDLEHPAYWGPVAGCGQKIVEMAAIATTLMLCGGRLAPCFPSHRREYRITTDRPIEVVDSGFAIPAELDGRRYREDMVEWTAHGVAARFPWGASAICCETGGGEPLLVAPWPNTNLLHPLTRIPAIRWRLEPGAHRLATWATGNTER